MPVKIFKDEDEQTVNNLLKWWHREHPPVEGSRNNNVFILSCSLYRYGIDNHENILQENSNGLKSREIKTIMKSAYQTTTDDGTIGTKTFEKQEFVKVIEPLKKGDKPKKIEINPKILKGEDLEYLITQELGHTIRFNEVTQNIEIDGKAIDDAAEAVLYLEVDTFLKKIGGKKDLSKGMFNAALLKLSQNNYNPLQDFFTQNHWDKTPRLQDFLGSFEDKHGASKEYLMQFLFGSIERLFKGYQNPVLVLDGAQGIGKSYVVKWLATPFQDYYREDGYINPDDKDSKLELTNHFLYEWGEAKGFSRKEVHGLKSLIFSENIQERRAYTRHAKKLRLIANIVMTKNEDGGFLRDETGNRRFNTLFIKNIDQGYSKRIDPIQLWLEIYALWNADTKKNWQNIDQERKQEIDDIAFDEPACWETFDKLIEKADPNNFLTAGWVHDVMDTQDLKWNRNQKTYQAYIHSYMKKRYNQTTTVKKIEGKSKRGYPGYAIRQPATSVR